MKWVYLSHQTVIMALMGVSIQLCSVKNGPKLNSNGIEEKKIRVPGIYIDAGCYLEIISFRFARKSAKIDEITRLRVLNLLNQEIVFVRFWCHLYLTYLCTTFNSFIRTLTSSFSINLNFLLL